MAIWNLGSINIDHFYRVPRIPVPGETLAATTYATGLGGKGANQSIAAARGGAQVMHIGAVGPDGDRAIAALAEVGIDTGQIAVLDMPTGHAIINVDDAGENAIVIFSSANVALTQEQVRAALAKASQGDVCLLQNETNLAPYAAEIARGKGMRVIYSAAPFDADHAADMLAFTDLLVLNEVEAAQLSEALGVSPAHLPVAEVLITRGAKGAIYRSGGDEISVPAFAVEPVDTTGAGDCYLGFFAAGQSAGMDVKGAMTFAAAAAAIQVTQAGTADAMPDLQEVKAFLEDRLAS